MNYWDLSFQEVQQSLSEKIEEADKMIKTLDSCIDELKTGTAVFPNMKLCPFFCHCSIICNNICSKQSLRCLCSLCLELTAIEEKGPEGSPGLKWCQEGKTGKTMTPLYSFSCNQIGRRINSVGFFFCRNGKSQCGFGRWWKVRLEYWNGCKCPDCISLTWLCCYELAGEK